MSLTVRDFKAIRKLGAPLLYQYGGVSAKSPARGRARCCVECNAWFALHSTQTKLGLVSLGLSAHSAPSAQQIDPICHCYGLALLRLCSTAVPSGTVVAGRP